jgi:ribose transport system ATP-binding protein
MKEADSYTPRLEMRGVRRSFGATLALRGVELTVAPGEVMARVGETARQKLLKVGGSCG